jgi:HEAT repeats
MEQFLFKLLSVLMLNFTQCAGIVVLIGCELTPTKVMEQQQDDPSVEIDRLTQQLRSGNNIEQNNMGKLTKSTVLQILQLLKDSNSGIRQMAVTALGKMGKSSKAMIPQLVPLLKDPDEYVRSHIPQVNQERREYLRQGAPKNWRIHNHLQVIKLMIGKIAS